MTFKLRLVRNSFTFAGLSPDRFSLSTKLTLKQKLLTMANSKNAAQTLNVTPLHDRVIVKPAKAEEKTAGGIIIPDTAKEKPQRGTVIAAGPGKKDEPVTVKVGDTVLYGKYSGTEIQLEGDDLLIMRESDILAIV
jgi:chaperonin GroES